MKISSYDYCGISPKLLFEKDESSLEMQDIHYNDPFSGPILYIMLCLLLTNFTGTR